MKYLFLRILLMPFTIFYLTGVWIRNFMYSKGILKSVEFEVPVISVGNLKAGGTGKSPMVEYLASLLSNKKNTAILSRGYKRLTSGFRMAGEEDTPAMQSTR